MEEVCLGHKVLVPVVTFFIMIHGNIFRDTYITSKFKSNTLQSVAFLDVILELSCSIDNYSFWWRRRISGSASVSHDDRLCWGKVLCLCSTIFSNFFDVVVIPNNISVLVLQPAVYILMSRFGA